MMKHYLCRHWQSGHLKQLCEEDEFQRLKNDRNDSHKELVKEWNANK